MGIRAGRTMMLFLWRIAVVLDAGVIDLQLRLR